MGENTTKMWISPDNEIVQWVWDQEVHHIDKLQELTKYNNIPEAIFAGWCRATVGKNHAGRYSLFLDVRDDARAEEALEILGEKYPEVTEITVCTNTFIVVQVNEGESLAQAWRHRNGIRHRVAADRKPQAPSTDDIYNNGFIAPDGKTYNLGDVDHGTWVKWNQEWLRYKGYDIPDEAEVTLHPNANIVVDRVWVDEVETELKPVTMKAALLASRPEETKQRGRPEIEASRESYASVAYHGTALVKPDHLFSAVGGNGESGWVTVNEDSAQFYTTWKLGQGGPEEYKVVLKGNLKLNAPMVIDTFEDWVDYGGEQQSLASFMAEVSPDAGIDPESEEAYDGPSVLDSQDEISAFASQAGCDGVVYVRGFADVTGNDGADIEIFNPAAFKVTGVKVLLSGDPESGEWSEYMAPAKAKKFMAGLAVHGAWSYEGMADENQDIQASRPEETRKFWIDDEGYVCDTEGMNHEEWLCEHDLCTGKFQDPGEEEARMVKKGWARAGYNADEHYLYVKVKSTAGVRPVLRQLEAFDPEVMFVKTLIVDDGTENYEENEITVDEGEDALKAWDRRHSPRKRIRADWLDDVVKRNHANLQQAFDTAMSNHAATAASQRSPLESHYNRTRFDLDTPEAQRLIFMDPNAYTPADERSLWDLVYYYWRSENGGRANKETFDKRTHVGNQRMLQEGFENYEQGLLMQEERERGGIREHRQGGKGSHGVRD